MRSCYWLVPVVALIASSQLLAEEKDKLAKALAELKGGWTIQSVKVLGEDVKTNAPDSNEVEFTAEHIVHDGNKTKFTIFADSDPKLIDVTVASDSDDERTLEGIYKIEDDKLTICLFVGEGTKVRPDSFEPAEERLIVKMVRKQ